MRSQCDEMPFHLDSDKFRLPCKCIPRLHASKVKDRRENLFPFSRVRDPFS